MRPDQKRKFGRVDLDVTGFAFGTAPVGNFVREIDEETSDAMFQTAWAQGVRFFDTAPMYGHGLSELRTGQSLRWKKRDDALFANASSCSVTSTGAPSRCTAPSRWSPCMCVMNLRNK